MKVADKLVELAGEDEEKGRLFSAGPKLQRAALYYLTAERMQDHYTYSYTVRQTFHI